MEWGADIQWDHSFGAAHLLPFAGAVHSTKIARDDDLVGPVDISGRANLSLALLGTCAFDVLQRGPHYRSHRASAHLHCLLHVAAARANDFDRISKSQSTAGHKG